MNNVRTGVRSVWKRSWTFLGVILQRFGSERDTRVYTIIKIGARHFEMDCEWNFMSQTFKIYFAESNNQNEFFFAGITADRSYTTSEVLDLLDSHEIMNDDL